MAKIAAKNSSCVITALGPPPLFGVWAIAYAKSTMKWSLRSFDTLGRVAHGFYPIIRRLSPIAGREPSSCKRRAIGTDWCLSRSLGDRSTLLTEEFAHGRCHS